MKTTSTKGNGTMAEYKSNARNHARYIARAIVMVDYRTLDHSITIVAICEKMDEDIRCNKMAWKTILGAARAAAKGQNRYDAKNDELTAGPDASIWN